MMGEGKELVGASRTFIIIKKSLPNTNYENLKKNFSSDNGYIKYQYTALAVTRDLTGRKMEHQARKKIKKCKNRGIKS